MMNIDTKAYINHENPTFGNTLLAVRSFLSVVELKIITK